MRIHRLSDADAVADAVADTLWPIFRDGGVIGLATGSTPIPVYRRLVERCRSEGFCADGLTTFNLDEYVGLPPTHEQSYRQYMARHLFKPIGLPANQTHLPRGNVADLTAECDTYEQKIRDAGGIDIQLLGLGRNGHIAFNEPGSSPDSSTRVVDLAESTIRANARFFDSDADVPRRAISMGIGTILRARRIVVMVCGESKRDAFERATTGSVSRDSPASLLRPHDQVDWFVTFSD